jgi:[ribosomal protein S5]-alanine N-acetyltransferase
MSMRETSLESENTGTLYFLRSQRLGFRTWREEDLSLATDLWGDPEVMRFIDIRVKLTDDQVKEILEKYMAMQRDHGVQYWPIFLLSSGEHVGCCGLRPYEIAGRIYELGVHIRSAWWRQGLAEEAARAVIDYAFSRLRATALFAGHNPHNLTSQSLLQKLGFRYTHHEYYPATGLEHPSYLLTHK